MKAIPGMNEVSVLLVVVPLKVAPGIPGPKALASMVLDNERKGTKMVPCSSKRRPMNPAVQAGFQAIEPVASRQRPVSAPPMASFTGPAPCRKCPSVPYVAAGHVSTKTTRISNLKNAAVVCFVCGFMAPPARPSPRSFNGKRADEPRLGKGTCFAKGKPTVLLYLENEG